MDFIEKELSAIDSSNAFLVSKAVKLEFLSTLYRGTLNICEDST